MDPIREPTSPAFERWLEGFREAHGQGSTSRGWRRMRRRLFGRIVMGLLLVLVAVGLAMFSTLSMAVPINEADHFVVRNWDARDGLPQNSARVLLHASDGYLWIGTQGGLSRFDGIRFTNFRVADHPDLGSNRIQGLLEDRDGRLWIGTEDGGLVRRIDGTFERLPLCGQRCMVFHILEGADGNIWVNTNAGIFSLEAETGWVNEQKLLPGDFSQGGAMAWDPMLGLTVINNSELIYWNLGDPRPRRISTPDGSAINALHRMDDELWLATFSTVFAFRDGRLEPVLDAHGNRLPATRALHRDTNGQVWIGPDGSGLLRLTRAGELHSVDAMQGVSLATIGSDREGNLWLGSDIHGLFRLQVALLHPVGEHQPALDGPVMPIMGDSGGGVLIGRVCGGLLRYDTNGVVENLSAQWPRLLEDCIWTLGRNPAGELLVGTTNGPLYRLGPDGPERLRYMDGSPAQLSSRFFYRGPGGRVWLGTNLGLFEVNGDRVIPVPDSPREIFLSAHTLPGGEMLFGTGNGLVRFNGHVFRNIDTGTVLDRLPVRAIHRDSGGVLWLGTYGGGLWHNRGDHWTQISTRQGLYDDVVSCILEDRSGRFWMSGNRGIFSVRRQDLDELVAGNASRVASPGLNRHDGMPSDETNGGGQPACHEDASGQFWFPTISGPVVLDPDHATRQIPQPPLSIESVIMEGREITSEAGMLDLPAGARNLEINYTAIHLSASERLQFRYRLAGYEDDWTLAGGRRTAYYPVLPAGSYRFEVQVGTDDGTWFPVRSSVELKLPRRIFEQPLFYLALTVLVVLAIVLFTRWRMQELERRDRELQSQVEMRTRELRENNQALARLAQVDELTGIANYRRLRLYLNEQWERCRELRQRLSVIVIDVDKFKPYNDALGHQAGDECLRSLAQSLDVLVQARGGLLARYGGEEFLAVLPGQEINEAADIAEQLRQAVESLGIARPEPERGVLTASFGVGSTEPGDINDPDQLIAAGDRALYRAKEKGRNRVEVELPDDHDRPRPNLRWARGNGGK